MAEHEAILAAWTGIGPRYDGFVTPSTIAVAETVPPGAGVRPGTRVLDVAAGSGGSSLPPTRGGTQIRTTDISPAMGNRLRVRGPADGFTARQNRGVDPFETLDNREDGGWG